MTDHIFQLLIPCILSFIGITLYLHWARQRSILDCPNSRSSHSIPTPTGGGLITVISFLMIILFPFFHEVIPHRLLISVGISTVILATTHFKDDLTSIPIKWRLLSQFAAVGLFLLLNPNLVSLNLGFTVLHSNYLLWPLLTIGIVWLINLYNFMDGIDGIACSEAIFILSAMSLFLYWHHQAALFWLGLQLILLSVIFISWNWSPAKIFLGDTGSSFLGFILGILALNNSYVTGIPIWSFLILFGTFFVDATVTVLRRILLGKTFYQAHCSHIYQRLAKRWRSHPKVCLLYSLVNVAWLLPWSLLAYQYPKEGILFTFAAFIPLAIIAWYLGAGYEFNEVLARKSPHY